MTVLFSHDFNIPNENPFLDPLFEDPSGGVFAVVSNQLSVNSVGGGGAAVLYTTTAAHAALTEGKVSVTRRRGSGFTGGVIVLAPSLVDLEAGYILLFQGADSVDLYRLTNFGTYDTIATRTIAHGSDDKYSLAFQVNPGNVTLKIFRNDEQLGADVVDSSAERITAAGRTGIISYAIGDLFDDFLVEDIAGGGGISGTLATTDSGPDALAVTGNVTSAGIRLTLRDTDTGAVAANLTGLKVAIRNASDAAGLLASGTRHTDANGVLEFAIGAIGNVGDSVYVSVEMSDNSVVAMYRVEVVDLNAY